MILPIRICGLLGGGAGVRLVVMLWCSGYPRIRIIPVFVTPAGCHSAAGIAWVGIIREGGQVRVGIIRELGWPRGGYRGWMEVRGVLLHPAINRTHHHPFVINIIENQSHQAPDLFDRIVDCSQAGFNHRIQTQESMRELAVHC